uniref:60S ribosomal protein L31 n=1 Tax=Aegilops tauschii TaxID=37682 RepID=R7WDC3_AEGTA
MSEKKRAPGPRKDEVVTREYTVNLHKRLHGCYMLERLTPLIVTRMASLGATMCSIWAVYFALILSVISGFYLFFNMLLVRYIDVAHRYMCCLHMLSRVPFGRYIKTKLYYLFDRIICPLCPFIVSLSIMPGHSQLHARYIDVAHRYTCCLHMLSCVPFGLYIETRLLLDLIASPLCPVIVSTFKKKAPNAIKEIRKFAQKAMGTNDVRIDVKLNKHIWSSGIRSVPRRVRVRIARKRNDEEDAKEELYSLVTVAEVPQEGLKGLGTKVVEDED